MTRGQAKTKIKYNLDDLGIYYDDADLNDSIQDAYDEIAVVSEAIHKQIDLNIDVIINSTGGGKPWVNIRGLIPDYYRALGILNLTTKQFMTPNIDRNEDHYKIDWQIHNDANSYSFIINGPDWIAFPNGYWTSSNKYLRFFYIATASKLLTDNDSFKILNEYQDLVELYCTADLLEQNREFTKASGYWVNYESTLEQYRLKILLLSKADRQFFREIC